MANVNRIALVATLEGEGQVKRGLGGMEQSTNRLKSAVKAAVASFAGFYALRNLVTSAADFEAAMANVSTLVDTNAVSMERWKAQIEEMAVSLGRGTADLAGGLYQVVSAGVDTAHSMDVLEAAAKAAKAGLSTTEEATLAITKALNIYSLDASEAGRVSDLFFKTVEKGQTTFPELARQIGRVLPFAKSLGVSMEDSLAVFAGLTTILGTTEQAATAMEATFRAFVTSGEKFREAGVDIQEVLSRDGLTGALRALEDVTGGNAEELKAMGIETEALRGVLGLFGGKLDQVEEGLSDFHNAAGATEEAVAKQAETLKDRFNKALAATDVLASRMAEKTFPVLAGALDATSSGLKGLAYNLDLVEEGLAAVAAGLGAAALLGAPSMVAGITGAFAALNAVLAANPIGAAVVLLTAAFFAAKRLGEAIFGANAEAERLRQTWADIAEQQKYIAEQQKYIDERAGKYNAKLHELGFKTMREFNRAVKEGLVVFDQAAGKWRSLAEEQEEAVKATTEELKKHYGTLMGLHDEAIDRMKAKSEELLQVEQAIRQARMTTEDLILGIRQRGMTEEEKYYSTLQRLDERYRETMALSGDEKVRMLQALQREWAGLTGEVRGQESVWDELEGRMVDRERVVVSAAEAEALAIMKVADLGEEIRQAEEQKKAAILEEIPVWQRVKDEATAAMDAIRAAIDGLPGSKKLDIEAGAALQAVRDVQARLDAIPDLTVKTLQIRVETVASPAMPFSEGMDYIRSRMLGLPGETEHTIRFAPEGFPGDMGPGAFNQRSDFGRAATGLPAPAPAAHAGGGVNLSFGDIHISGASGDGRQFAVDFQDKLADDILNDRSPVTAALRRKIESVR